MCRSLHFAFSLTCTLSRSFQSVTAKNRKEVLAVRISFRKEVLALLSCNRKEVLAVSRTQAQVTRNQPQEELLLADAKRSSCACIIFGLYCTGSYTEDEPLCISSKNTDTLTYVNAMDQMLGLNGHIRD